MAVGDEDDEGPVVLVGAGDGFLIGLSVLLSTPSDDEIGLVDGVVVFALIPKQESTTSPAKIVRQHSDSVSKRTKSGLPIVQFEYRVSFKHT